MYNSYDQSVLIRDEYQICTKIECLHMCIHKNVLYICIYVQHIYLSTYLIYLSMQKKCKTLWCCSNYCSASKVFSFFHSWGAEMPTIASLIGLMCQFSRRSNDQSERAFGRLYLIMGSLWLYQPTARVFESKKDPTIARKGAKQRGTNI